MKLSEQKLEDIYELTYKYQMLTQEQSIGDYGLPQVLNDRAYIEVEKLKHNLEIKLDEALEISNDSFFEWCVAHNRGAVTRANDLVNEEKEVELYTMPIDKVFNIIGPYWTSCGIEDSGVSLEELKSDDLSQERKELFIETAVKYAPLGSSDDVEVRYQQLFEEEKLGGVNKVSDELENWSGLDINNKIILFQKALHTAHYSGDMVDHLVNSANPKQFLDTLSAGPKVEQWDWDVSRLLGYERGSRGPRGDEYYYPKGSSGYLLNAMRMLGMLDSVKQEVEAIIEAYGLDCTVAEFNINGNVDWPYLSIYQNLSEDFIREFQDKVIWVWISEYKQLSEEFIREFQDKVFWEHISQFQDLSEDFIKEFQNKIHFDVINKNPYVTLSKEFVYSFQSGTAKVPYLLEDIYELTYKYQMIQQEQSKGDYGLETVLEDKAYIELEKIKEGLNNKLNEMYEPFINTYSHWLSVHDQDNVYDKIDVIYNKLHNEYQTVDLDTKIILFHEALTTVHHGGIMADHLLGFNSGQGTVYLNYLTSNSLVQEWNEDLVKIIYHEPGSTIAPQEDEYQYPKESNKHLLVALSLLSNTKLISIN